MTPIHAILFLMLLPFLVVFVFMVLTLERNKEVHDETTREEDDNNNNAASIFTKARQRLTRSMSPAESTALVASQAATSLMATLSQSSPSDLFHAAFSPLRRTSSHYHSLNDLSTSELVRILLFLDVRDLVCRAGMINSQYWNLARSNRLWSRFYQMWNPISSDLISKTLYLKLLRQYFAPERRYMFLDENGRESFCTSMVFATNYEVNDKIRLIKLHDSGVVHPVIFNSTHEGCVLFKCQFRDDTGLEIHWRNNDTNDEWSIILSQDSWKFPGRIQMQGVRLLDGREYAVRAVSQETPFHSMNGAVGVW